MIVKMNRVYMYFIVEVYRVKKKEAAFWATYKVIIYFYGERIFILLFLA